jgi:hypothetical protein
MLTLWIFLFLFLRFCSCDLNSLEIASWDRPRAALIRNDIFLEGGQITTGNWSGPTGSDLAWPTTDNVVDSNIYRLSLNESFSLDGTNNPAQFHEVVGGYSAIPWFDGYMFADYDEFYTWGGMSIGATDGAGVVTERLYDAPQFSTNNLNRPDFNYVPKDSQGNPFVYAMTNGAGANAPSENLGFYFGGFDSSNLGPLSFDSADSYNLSQSFIQVDTKEPGDAVWSAVNIEPLDLKSRAEGGLVWLPAGKRGVLLLLGGVLKPTDVSFYVPNDASAEEGNDFTSVFSLYDLDSQQWFTQSLKDSSQKPDGPIAQFCTTVASYDNGSHVHHDIYVFGGWDGNSSASISSDVWVLTVPTFEWLKMPVTGRDVQARQGHQCFRPLPDQMFSIGGLGLLQLTLPQRNIIDVFNLNDLTWQNSYDPSSYRGQ